MSKPTKTQEPGSQKTDSGVNPFVVLAVFRDVIIIVALSWGAALFHGFVCTRILHPSTLVLGISFLGLMFILMIAGYTISACLVRMNRWRHLIFVGLGVWILDFFGFVYFWSSGYDYVWYLATRLLFIVIPMLLGGAISHLLDKTLE
jgi:hypothetical protein